MSPFHLIHVENIFFPLSMHSLLFGLCTGQFILGVHNLNFTAGPNFFCHIQGQKLIGFNTFKEFFYQRNKQNKPNLVLHGPDLKLSRATFGPRAVCCACLGLILTHIYNCLRMEMFSSSQAVATKLLISDLKR
jgi:hypothetical protein